MVIPPVPVVFLYDPEEFWEHIRQLIREELARTAGRQAIYTTEDVRRLFQLPADTMDDWIRRGILKPINIRGDVYFLHADLEHLFRPPSSGDAAEP
jgi:Helix-turn-helix domain